MTKSIEEELVVPHPSMKSQPSDIPDADNVKPLVDTACFKACATHATSKHAYATHPLDPLTSSEIRAAAAAALSVVPKPKTPESSSSEASSTEGSGSVEKPHARFSYISLREPHKKEVAEWVMSKQKEQSEGNDGSIGDRGTHSVMVPAVPIRVAEAVLMVPATGLAYKVLVQLAATTEASASTKDEVLECVELPRGTQPCFTPDDCFLAEAIVKADPRVQELVLESFGIEDLSMLACDPWSVHLADPAGYAPLKWREQNTETQGQGKLPPPRLVQTFLYRRDDEEDNHYAHPLPLLPVVDLNAEQVVALQGADDPDLMSQPIPSASVNYHRRKLASNDYLPKTFRAEPPKPLDITQPEGPSFTVHGRNEVTWQGWSFRVGFNYREALVVHDVRFQGRSVLARASLVEMTVPYAEPRAPFQSKNAGDVGDYGLGYCTTSLELCSDCNGDITYFDAVLADSHGEPYTVKKAVCMHEEDGGVLWKHVEYRNPEMAETRRARVLVLQSSYTVVNYEYLSYVTFGLDGSIAFDLKLTGELSTNLATKDEQTCGTPDYGTFVAPGVNAQLHQHQFCYRLDMAIDGSKNRVVETTLQPVPRNPKTNPYGNAIQKVSVPLETETAAIRPQLPPGGSWRIENAEGAKNEVNGQPTAYKLMPNTRGSPQPLLMTDAESAVSLRGAFATASLWVTPYSPDERYPAGEFPTQSIVTPGDLPSDGLAKWTSQDRNINGEDIVLWHSFGVTHVPRVEDFPVMPVEVTGFMLKPDGFFSGNPAIDLPPEPSGASKQCCIPAL